MTSYLGNYAWTFACNEPHHQFVARFFGISIFSMATNNVIFYIQVHFLGFYYTVAFLVATAASTLINFGVCKIVVFERRFEPL